MYVWDRATYTQLKIICILRSRTKAELNTSLYPIDQGWAIPVLEGQCVCRFLFPPITQAKLANWL